LDIIKVRAPTTALAAVGIQAFFSLFAESVTHVFPDYGLDVVSPNLEAQLAYISVETLAITSLMWCAISTSPYCIVPQFVHPLIVWLTSSSEEYYEPEGTSTSSDNTSVVTISKE
jgi:hypothetical protein